MADGTDEPPTDPSGSAFKLDNARRRALIAERAAAAVRVAALTRDIERLIEATTAANADDEHDPEGATIAFERAQAIASRARAEAILGEVDDALRRLEQGRYGTCELCGGRISADRLTAIPLSRTCIRCARQLRRPAPSA